MIVKVYCGRPGCGKLIGARSFSPEGKVLEEEYEPDIVIYKSSNLEDTWDGVTFCSQECCDRRDSFVTPEEVSDESDGM